MLIVGLFCHYITLFAYYIFLTSKENRTTDTAEFVMLIDLMLYTFQCVILSTPSNLRHRNIALSKQFLGNTEKVTHINTFTAIVDLSRFNNSCLTLNLITTTIVAPPSNASKWQMGFNSAFKGLKSPASTLVDLTFQSRALRSFSLNQLRNLSL